MTKIARTMEERARGMEVSEDLFEIFFISFMNKLFFFLGNDVDPRREKHASKKEVLKDDGNKTETKNG